MGLGLAFYAIKKDELNNAPQAVQKFVLRFFEEETILGMPCYVALECDEKSPWHDLDDNEYDEYEEGLSEEDLNGSGILEWLNVKKHPEFVSSYYWS
jgi:hypothetical protein